MTKRHGVYYLFAGLATVLCIMHSFVSAHEKVAVIPIGGAVGDAHSEDVLEGKTYSSKEGKMLTGSMVDNGTVTLSPGTVARSIPQGYHNGSGICEGDPDLVPENIPVGITLFGVEGVGDPDLVPENIPVGVTIFGVEGTLSAPYFNHGNGTITDSATGLNWQQADSDSKLSWLDAKTYCDDFSLGDKNDWRLPTKEELKSLVVCTEGKETPLPDGQTCSSGYTSPTISSQFSCEQYFYWTSTEKTPGVMYYVEFLSGRATSYSSSEPFYVRCVR